MKRMLALILAALLLCGAASALAEEYYSLSGVCWRNSTML